MDDGVIPHHLPMTNLTPQELVSYLKDQRGLSILDLIDLDLIVGQSRKILFQKFQALHKSVFANNERIVLYSRSALSRDLLRFVQTAGSKIDISNAFILICAPSIDTNLLDQVRQRYSYDQCVFDTLEINISDPRPSIETNPLLNLPDSFCFSPWAHLEISSRGEFRPCCVYKENVRDPQGRAYNILHDSIESVYQSKYMTDLRQQFAEGQRPQGCSHCWQSETTVGYSNRQWLTSHLGVKADSLDVEKICDVSNLVSMDIKLGNVCNFRCRICGPESSSMIAEERWKHGDRSFDLKQLNAQGRWTENDEVWRALENFGNQLVNIDFYGGEPFLVKEHAKFLDHLIQKGYANRIRLHYNANGSIYPPQLFAKWQKFKAIDISFSIDDIGPRFELQRGGRWSDVQTNLNNFLSARLPNMTLSIFPTINVQNIYYLPELIDWFESTGFDSLIFNILDKPVFLSIRNMGPELTDLVIDRLSAMAESQKEKHKIAQLINFLKQEKKTVDRVEDLRQYVLELDRRRGQNFAESHPEVAKVIYIGT
jgi:MoaA/NifB/PqqE/SkfB family radical SAM enzyme